jgi:hypothetical protein
MKRECDDVSFCYGLLFLEERKILVRRWATRAAFGCEELDEYRLRLLAIGSAGCCAGSLLVCIAQAEIKIVKKTIPRKARYCISIL